MSVSYPPKKNTAHTFFVCLPSQANPNIFQSSATLATGDVKVSIDGGSLTNLATLPVVTPAAGVQIQVDLSASEMNGNKIGVWFRDAAGAEWCDLYYEIATVTAQIDNLAQAVWDVLTSALTTANSIGKKLADWVLGSDSKVILSNNAHTGAVVPTVTDVTTKTGYAIGVGGIASTSFAANAIDSAALDPSATPRVLKNVALSNFEFLMVDSADHVAPKTGLIFIAGDAQVSIDGAAFTNLTNLPAEVGSGIYKINLAAADMNGDTITLKFSKSGADNRLISVVTQP